MFRAIIRFVGFWLLAGAFIGVVADGARSIAAGEVLMVPAGEVWRWLAPQSLETVRTAFETQGLRLLWDPALVTALKAPASLLGIALAALLLWAGRRRRPREAFGEPDLS